MVVCLEVAAARLSMTKLATIRVGRRPPGGPLHAAHASPSIGLLGAVGHSTMKQAGPCSGKKCGLTGLSQNGYGLSISLSLYIYIYMYIYMAVICFASSTVAVQQICSACAADLH